MPTPTPARRPDRAHAAWGWGTEAPLPTRPPLTIRRSPTGYVVEDPALTRLAGLGPIPLPFTPEASGDEVLAHLQRLNPHREVRLDETPLVSSLIPARGGAHIPPPEAAHSS
ncbi:MAG: hypothetical protein SangKO_099180 [Sandaracinaceae bacterium]